MMNVNIDEKEWVIHMSNILNNGDEIDIKNPVCIFQVSRSIRDTKPEAYTSQVVALGPYHHFRPKTYYMQNCKLTAALQARKQLKLREIPEMVNTIKDKLPDFRACYHDHLGLENETLAWIMLIDGLFLLSLIQKPENDHQVEKIDQLEDLSGTQLPWEDDLEDDVLLQNPIPIAVEVSSSVTNDSNQKEDLSGTQLPCDDYLEDDVLLQNPIPNAVEEVSSSVKNDSDQFEDSRGRKYPLDSILKDVVLLENQIPNIVLETLLIMETEDDSMYKRGQLSYNLTDFCTGLSPIELQGNTTHYEMEDPHHVLDFLHQLVWLGKVTISPRIGTLTDTDIKDSDVKTWTNLYSQLSNLNFGFVSMILALVDFILKILDALGISIPRDIFSEKEALIPSASQLSGVGMKFCRVGQDRGGIKDIAVKHETDSRKKDRTDSVTLSLPVLSANVNSDLSEAVMRNLLAYEAEATPKSPKFSRYIELMSALMQTTADVELLKKADTNFHVVPENAKSAEVVKLFSSLKEAVGSKGMSELDDTIKEVNGFYDNCRKVKIRRLVKRYLFVSWKVLTGIALILVLILLLWQTFCSIYSCPKIFKSQYLAYLVL